MPAVYGAVLAVAGAPEAFVHLYAYSRHDQSVLLATLRAPRGAAARRRRLFDLLTDTAALVPVSPLAQPMVSFLADEVRDRLTLDVTCASLHEVATRLGFKWGGPTPAGAATDFRARFRARVFDSRRLVDLPVQAAARPGRPGRCGSRGAARFRSQIPLEYAYGAWGALPDPTDALQERLLQPFRIVTWDELEGFAVHRMRALAHVEGGSATRAATRARSPSRCRPWSPAPRAEAAMPRALQDFLLIEHHARTQDVLLAYAQPIGRRVESGRAMLLERLHFRELGEGNAEAACRVVFDEAGGDPALAEQALRLKERDWVVVNPVGTVAPTAMVHGRLATLEGLDRDADGRLTARLALKGLSPYRRAFAYWHRREEALRPGERYAVDEMPDDLNGDKLLAACRRPPTPAGLTPSSPGSTTRGARPWRTATGPLPPRTAFKRAPPASSVSRRRGADDRRRRAGRRAGGPDRPPGGGHRRAPPGAGAARPGAAGQREEPRPGVGHPGAPGGARWPGRPRSG